MATASISSTTWKEEVEKRTQETEVLQNKLREASAMQALEEGLVPFRNPNVLKLFQWFHRFGCRQQCIPKIELCSCNLLFWWWWWWWWWKKMSPSRKFHMTCWLCLGEILDLFEMHHPVVASFNLVKPHSSHLGFLSPKKEFVSPLKAPFCFFTLKTNWCGMPGRVAAAERREWTITEEVARSNNAGNLSCHFFPVSSCKKEVFFVSGVGIHILLLVPGEGSKRSSIL